ncbi:MAG: shikimate kinase [Pseudomonadota bacterium]
MATRAELKKTIVLVGMMGSGKTAVGRALATLLAVPFRDSDAAVVEAANMSIAEIFERDGEAFFRKKEAQIISRLMELDPPGILSTGGGAFLNPETRAVVASAGASVWLQASEPILWDRVRTKDTRPLLRTADPRATLRTLLAEREPFYSEAGVSVEADAKLSVAEMALKVSETLMRERPDVLQRIEDA